jgi:hypothetical protein
VNESPEFFVLRGDIAELVDTVPVSYRAQLAAAIEGDCGGNA